MTPKNWARQWKKAREDRRRDCERVLEIWKKDPSKYCRKAESWMDMALGYRKRGKNYAGERTYEKALLDKGLSHLRNEERNKTLTLKVRNHAVSLANRRSGQTITDCMGVLCDPRGRKHPVAIEIKEKANDPWYAVVEVLQQMRLMRSSVKELEKYFKFQKEISIKDVKGAWGMVLAPESFYEKDSGKAAGSYQAACKLCDYMAKETNARVIMVSFDGGDVTYKAGYWPR